MYKQAFQCCLCSIICTVCMTGLMRERDAGGFYLSQSVELTFVHTNAKKPEERWRNVVKIILTGHPKESERKPPSFHWMIWLPADWVLWSQRAQHCLILILSMYLIQRHYIDLKWHSNTGITYSGPATLEYVFIYTLLPTWVYWGGKVCSWAVLLSAC